MAGWHHRLYGHEFEQTLGVGDGQGSLACCSPWGHKESDSNERLNNDTAVLTSDLSSLEMCTSHISLFPPLPLFSPDAPAMAPWFCWLLHTFLSLQVGATPEAYLSPAAGPSARLSPMDWSVCCPDPHCGLCKSLPFLHPSVPTGGLASYLTEEVKVLLSTSNPCQLLIPLCPTLQLLPFGLRITLMFFCCHLCPPVDSRALVVVAHRLSCPSARGLFQDQGSNPCPLHWQVDSWLRIPWIAREVPPFVLLIHL